VWLGLAESRSCVGSLLVMVRVSLEGGAAPKRIPYPITMLFPKIEVPPTCPFWLAMLMAGAVTVVTSCTD